MLTVFQAMCFGSGAALAQAPQNGAPPPSKNQQVSADPDARPYDAQIYRLSEILGAIHYLRALCGAGEGQVWRKQMHDLVNAEGTSALRRARLVDNFNKGYRGYARTYRTCTKSALVAINRFMKQGVSIAERLSNEKKH
ncbi:MAG: TIGR02301 family protein [Alphaproteobacteria bacterium]